MKEGKDDLEAELNQMYDSLMWFHENMDQTYVVASNHDDMLDRAMYMGDWRDNLKNAEIFVNLLKIKLSGEAENGLIPYLINKDFDSEGVYALGIEESLMINGVELGMHGHKGPNGSKGSIKTFAKLPYKTVIGHSHAPGIQGNCYQVGISCAMKHGYNTGLSSWAYAGVTVNKHGMQQLIVLNNNSLTYTTLDKQCINI